MPREKDSFRRYVAFPQNGRWKCQFCDKEYSGSVTRIKAHLAGVGGKGIDACKDVSDQVKLEAKKALNAKGAAESSNGEEGTVEEGQHMPVTANNEDAWRGISFATTPYLSTGGASSLACLSLPETNLPSQSLPAENMIPRIWLQQPQSQALDSSIQLPNSSDPSSRPDLALEALTTMPQPLNAEEGEPNTEVPHDARTDDALVDSRPGTFGLLIEYLSTLKSKLDELSSRVANSDELETWRRKAKRLKGESSSMVQAFREGGSLSPQLVKRVDDLSKEVEDILGNCSLQEGSTTHAARWRKSLPLETTELVGGESMAAIGKICHYLMEDHIVIIGVYGMGGVGKTSILMHVHNRVLENPAFNDVFWVTVPQEFSVCELQDEIANAVGLDNLSKDRDMKRRASILKWHLKKKRAILILDGLWMHFDIRDVGIPLEKGGIKMVLTTRSLDVCHKMLCQKQIEIRPLYEEDDSWDLFLKTLCFGGDLPSQVKNIATSILVKCGGLPLGIIEIATHMRGVKEVHEWKDLLQKLENSMMELNVFKKLKLGYMNLGNLQVQQCFLHLILCFGEYNSKVKIIKEVLIESFIDEGLLSGIATRQELHNKGNTILDDIKKAYLGVDINKGCLFVHPLVRDMALQIVTSTTHMVKANMGLKEITKQEFWTDHLEKVFLQNNDIKKIPDGISPNCRKLIRLSLNGNVSLEAIHKSFFRDMKGLKVLDLSKTKITRVPDIISDLECLETLLFQECEELCHIPCVQKLGCLRKLDLRGCAMLEVVPEGMEMLVRLTYLDLLGTKIKTLSEGALGKLVNLQYLMINSMVEEESEEEEEMELTEEELTEEEEEMELIEQVEGFYCYVPNVETFNACTIVPEKNSSLPYELALNALRKCFFRHRHERQIIIESCHSIAVRVDGAIGGDGYALLPKNVQVLNVRWCDGMTSLCKVGPLNDLEKLKIKEWEKLGKLGAVHFPRLRRLSITGCSKLKHLREGEQRLPHLQWFRIGGSEELEGINIAAPFLYNIEVYRCPKMKRVVEWEWLPKLRSIEIRNCEKLEEIIGGPATSINATCRLVKIKIAGCNKLKRVLMTHNMLLCLPFLRDVSVKDCASLEVIIDNCESLDVIIDNVPNIMPCSSLYLTYLTLVNLPELKSICDGIVDCRSIECMDIRECPKLQRLSLLDDGLPRSIRSCVDYNICIDELTWQSLEWDHSLGPPSLLGHLAKKYEGVPNRHDQRMHVTISCDDIAARAYGEIGGDGRDLLPKNVQVLTVGRGSGVTSLSEVGPLENLEELEIEEWEKLEELGAVHFPHLQGLKIISCPKLKHLSMEGQGLPHLQWLRIYGLKELEGIDLIAPTLNHIEVSDCPKMKRVVEWDWLATRLPNLKSIEISCCRKLEEIIGGPLPTKTTCLLTKIEIYDCDNMKGVLLTHDVLHHLPFLQEIKVGGCKGIEVIIGAALPSSLPKSTRLTLWHLPKLKRICDQISDDIRYIEIHNCPNLKRIPLQLHLIDNDLLSPPPSLERILIDRLTWQALEWDHPLARISLEPLVEFNGELPASFTFLLSSPSKDRFLTVR
ncbi:hypothetical protein BT93_F1222 [Corymbia citriodora subsp. variegata]|nr:hypothetical protein BT93_F1222 [Corymbia citriodora subsp. variegata]